MNKYQDGGALPSVQIDTGFLGERINPVNINFNPNPTPIVDNTIAALQLGLSRDQQKIAQRQLDQSERRLDMDIMKFNKDLIAGALKTTQDGTDPTYGINTFTEKGRQLITKISEERSKAQDQANALWAETLVSGKVTPINIGKLNQAMSGVDKILQSPEYVTHVATNSWLTKAYDEVLKSIDDKDTIIDTEAFRDIENKAIQVLNSDPSQPLDFRMADIMNLKNVILKRVDFENEAAEVIEDYQNDNTKEQARFFRGNPELTEMFTTEDMRNAGKIPDILLEKWKLSSQGRAFIEKMGGEDKTKSWLSKMVELEIPNVGKLTETVTDLKDSGYRPYRDKTTSSGGGGTLAEKDRQSSLAYLNNRGFTVELPQVLDGDIEYKYDKADGSPVKEKVDASVAIQRFFDDTGQVTQEEKDAIEKQLGLKKYSAPNTDSSGRIQTDFSKFSPDDTNWDLLAKYESAGRTMTEAHMDAGEVSVGPYSLRGDKIQKFLTEKYGAPAINTKDVNSVQKMWDVYSAKPNFESDMRDWIFNNLHKPRLDEALKYIPVMDNSLKVYLTDAAHQLGNDSYTKMLKRSKEIMKEKGLSHANPFEVLQSVHEARMEDFGEKYGDRLTDLYAQSADSASAQAKIAAKLPFQVSPDVSGQSHKSYLELEYGMLEQLNNVFGNLDGADKLYATSLARGSEHPESQKNQKSQHKKGEAMDFRFNDESINIFKQLTGRTEFTPFKPYPIPGTKLEVMFEDRPAKHFHVSYKGEKVEVPTNVQTIKGYGVDTTIDFGAGKVTNSLKTLPTTETNQPISPQIQQPTNQIDQREKRILESLNPRLKK